MSIAAQGIPPRVGAFVIKGVLGRGSTSVVYRGAKDGQEFAIKVMLPTSHSDAAHRFRKEVSAIARISHEGLVRLAEAGEIDGRPYVATELVQGDTLDKVLAKGPLSEQQLIELSQSIASALGELHRRGFVHRDVKPENILLREGNRAKVIDLGFVAPMNEQLKEGEFVGTPHYAPPEQSGRLKRPIDGRSDLYSLGCVLFHCATGRPVFEGAVGDVVQMHAMKRAPDVHGLNSSIRTVLSAMIAKLLSKDPDDRYQSVESLLFDLEHLSTLTEASLGSHEVALKVSDVPMVGRHDELDMLRILWSDRTAKNKGAFLQIEGEGGLGKTRLCRELLELVRNDAGLILTAKANRGETTPMAPIREALDSWLSEARHWPELEREEAYERIRAAAGPMGAIIRRLTPALDIVFGDLPELTPLAPESEQERFYDAIANFFVGFAREFGSALILLDDAQWFDGATTELLGRIAARLDGTPLLTVTTARNDPESASATNDFVRVIGNAIHRIVLHPLDVGACKDLISAHLGGQKLTDSIAERLATKSKGNPFVLTEYLRSLLDQGVLRPTLQGWQAAIEGMETVELPDDVIEVLLRRIDGLAGEVVDHLAAAAVLGFAFDAALLAEIADARDDEVRKSLHHGLQTNLIEAVEEDRFAFVHDRVHEAFHARLSPERSQDIHQNIAETLDRSGNHSGHVVFALARHYAKGHPEEHLKRVYETNLTAGMRALSQFSNEEAYEFLRTAFETREKLPQAESVHEAEVAEQLGIACTQTARNEQAEQLLHRALDHATEVSDTARLHMRLEHLYTVTGQHSKAWEHVERALKALGAPYPRTVFGALMSTMRFWFSTMIRYATGWGFGKAGSKRELREQIAGILSQGGIMAYLLGDVVKMIYCAFRGCHNAHFLGMHPDNVRSHGFYGFYMGVFGALGVARRARKRVLAFGTQMTHEEARLASSFWSAFGVDMAGDTPTGFKAMVDMIPQMERYCNRWDVCVAYSHNHNTLRFLGKYRELIEFLSTRSGVGGKSRYETTWDANARLMQVTQTGGLYTAYINLGMFNEGEDMRRRVDLLNWKEDAFATSHNYGQMIEPLLLLESWEELEQSIENFEALQFVDYHGRYLFSNAAYARYELYLRATDPARRRSLWKKFRKAVTRITWGDLPWGRGRAFTPIHTCHREVAKALVALEKKKYRKALAKLAKALDLAEQVDSKSGLYWTYRTQARVYRKMGDKERMKVALDKLISLCRAEGYVPRLRIVADEFGLGDATVRSAPALTRSSTGSSSSAAETSKPLLEALLQVSLASSSTLEIREQARAALDAVVKVLGAERGLLFLVDDNDEGIDLVAGRRADGTDVDPSEPYSTTVIGRVQESHSSMVVTGTEEGLLLGSESVMAHNLRSIIAAPLLVRKKLVGVVYLDSTLAKGMFTTDDIAALVAIANHVAIAVETARAAHNEIERAALEKDLALTAAVQKLLLPRESNVETQSLRVSSYYRPAASCSGDWLWFDESSDGSVWLVVGDVTGHGIASAMVMAATAGAYHVLRKNSGQLDRTLNDLHAHFKNMMRGEYTITMAALRFTGSKLDVWSAGAPPVLLMKADSSLRVAGAPGMPLGSLDPKFKTGHVRLELAPGDRVIAFTDGLTEAEDEKGRQLGMKRLVRSLSDVRSSSPGDATDKLVSILDNIRGNSPQDDDWTFAIVDVKQPALSSLRTPKAS